jgi:hypothetical protein
MRTLLSQRRTPRASLSIALMMAAMGGTPTVAQTPRILELDPGMRIRMRMERQTVRLVGNVAEVRADSVIVAVPMLQIERWTIPFSQIAELHVSGGHRRLTLIGLAAGAGTGLLLTAAFNSLVQSQCFTDCPRPASAGLGAAIGGLILGTGLYFVRVERWLRFALPNRSSP